MINQLSDERRGITTRELDSLFQADDHLPQRSAISLTSSGRGNLMPALALEFPA